MFPYKQGARTALPAQPFERRQPLITPKQFPFLHRMLLFSLFILVVARVNAQNPCAGNSAGVGAFPVDFGMCDFDFSANVTINHEYPDGHDFIVKVKYLEQYFYFDESLNPHLSNISYDVVGSYAEVTATYSAPSALGGPTINNFEVKFRRIDTWSRFIATLKDAFIVTVIDPEPACYVNNEPFVMVTESFNLDSKESYVDLRALPYHSVSELALNGYLANTVNILVPDELVVDDFWDMDASSTNLGGKIRFLSGAKVTFPTGGFGTLRMNNISVEACPQEDLAEGFIVNPGSIFNSEQLTMKNCTVSDCRFAIEAKSNAILEISNTVFSDNYIGLNLDMKGAPVGAKHVVFNSFSNVTFKTEDGLRPPHANMPEQLESRGFCGIRLNDYHDFNMGQNTLFESLANGLVAIKSEMNIGSMTFRDIKGSHIAGPYPYAFAGRGVSMVSPGNTNWAAINPYEWESMTFENCLTGIYASGMAGTVRNCDMTMVDYGIDWVNSKQRDIIIKDNTISARSVGIRSTGNEPLYIGSKIEQNDITITAFGSPTLPSAAIRSNEFNTGLWGWNMLRNPISLQQGGRGIEYINGSAGSMIGNTIINQSQQQDYAGIWVEGCYSTELTNNSITQSGSNPTDLGNSQGIRSTGGIANSFNCNCLDNTNVGMLFYDMANFTNRVRGNNLNAHVTGLQVGDPNWTSAYIGTQIHRGNKWDLSFATGSVGDFGAVNYNAGGLAASIFKVDHAENPDFAPAVDPNPGWFIDEDQPGASYTCTSNCNFPQESGEGREAQEATELDHLIRSNSLTGTDEELWKGRFQLYRRILRQPALAAEPSMASWKAAYQNSSEGRLAEIAEARTHLYDLAASDAALAETHRTAVETQTQQLRDLDLARLRNEPVSKAQYDAAQQGNENTRAQWQQFWEGARAAQRQNALDLRRQNAGIPVSGLSDANHKTVNHILLGVAAGLELTEGDINTLDAIAQQCPSEGGDAVYEARSVAGFLLEKTYDNSACVPAGKKTTAQQTVSAAAPELTLFPNPTQGVLNWNVDGVARVKVWNQLGQMTVDQAVSGRSIDLGNVREGVYQVQLLNADGQLLIARPLAVIR